MAFEYFRTWAEKALLFYSVNEFIVPSKSQALALALEWRYDAVLNQKVEKVIKSSKTKGSEAELGWCFQW